jgi:acetylornithine deacetylase
MSIAETLGILERLISFRTVSSDSNLDCIAYIKHFLETCGARLVLQPDGTGAKANLIATIGPDVPGGVVLSGHTDVVPVAGQNWSHDPWTMTVEGSRIYGRGSTDMKGFLALMLLAARKASSRPLVRPLHLAFSYDEELGCLGARPLAELMHAEMPGAAAIIVGEPTSNRIASSHKGIVTFRTEIDGYSVHSSRVHEGVSAVTEAARLILWLEGLMYEDAKRLVSAVFDPPFTTIHCGVIAGGAAVNVVAPYGWFLTDIRTIEKVDPADYEAKFRRHVEADVLPALRKKQSSVDIRVIRTSLTPGLEPDAGNTAEVLVRGLTGQNGTEAVAYATEAGIYQQAGFPVVVCGPGDIAQAHQADEYIETAQLEEGILIIDRLLESLQA